MAFAFDLADYAAVQENAEAIYATVDEGSMPCDRPWPEEDVARLREWIDAGAPR